MLKKILLPVFLFILIVFVVVETLKNKSTYPK
ncbi:hypothetical protein FPOG_00759 [Fusobacterium periodonticum D10]|uniref:Uncharacterized protein n=1 Tax=Fusobacterium periodonticum D10 TaxID=620833 RepID=K1GGK3_9FUSO|nr:hypothetical protein FPOG_00759 [Fusobacterium periodonticum D10]